jgi:PAS domain S-box-containing protein
MQLDWIHAWTGLGALYLTALAFGGARITDEERTRRRWLGLFGLVVCVHEGLGLLEVGRVGPPQLPLVASALLVVACLAMLQYVRLSWLLTGRRPISAWAHLMAVALAVGGAIALRARDAASIEAVIRLFMGIPICCLGMLSVAWDRSAESSGSEGSQALRRPKAALTAWFAFALLMNAGLGIVQLYSIGPELTLSSSDGLLLRMLELLDGVIFFALAVLLFLRDQRHAGYTGGDLRIMRRVVPVLLVLIFVVGWIVTGVRGRMEDSSLREDMARQAAGVAKTIDPTLIHDLRFSEEDLKNPAYQVLRSQMTTYGEYAGYQSIYSMAIRNGRIVFGPENIPVDSPEASAPGDLYESPAPALKTVFETAHSTVVGPYRDEFGTFVSGFAPVVDPATRDVILVIGFDLNARDWVEKVAAARRTVILWMTTVCCLLLVGLLILRERARRGRASMPWFLAHAETLLTASLCLTLTLVLVGIAHETEGRKLRDTYSHLVSERSAAINDVLHHAQRTMARSVGRFEDSQVIADHDFDQFLAAEQSTSVFGAFAWIRTSPTGNNDQSIVTFARPQSVWGPLVAHGISSIAPLAQAIATARETHRPALTSPIEIGSGDPWPGIVAVTPINSGTDGAPIGFMAGVLPVRTLALAAGEGDNARSPDLDVALMDLTARSMIATTNTACPRELINTSTPGGSIRRPKNADVSPVFLFDHAYAIVTRPGLGFAASYYPIMEILAAVVGLLLSLFMTATVKLLRDRECSLQAQVAQRTAELERSEKNLATFFDSVDHHVFVINELGRIVTVNETVTRNLGYSREELKGVATLDLCPEDQREEARRVLQDVLENRTSRCRISVLAKDGRSIPSETTIGRGFWDGQPCIFAVNRDLSELQASQEMFSKTFQTSSTLMAISSATDRRFIDVNDAFLTTLGFTRDEVLGHTSEEIGIFVEPIVHENQLETFAREGRLVGSEASVRTKQGEARYGIFTADIVKLQSGPVILTTMSDVTDQRRAEKARLETEERYELVMRATDVALWDWNLQTGTIVVNDRMAEIFGYGAGNVSALTVETITALVHPEDQARSAALLSRHLRGESENYDCEHRIRHSSGGWIWVHTRGRIVTRTANGVPIRMTGTHLEITERKEAELARQRATALLTGLLDSIPDIVFFKDTDGVYLGCNPEFATFTQRSREQIVGHTDFDFFDHDLATFFREQDRVMLEKGQARMNEEWVDHPTRGHILLDTLKAPLHDPAGKLIGVVGVSRDVTDRQETEDRLSRANTHLERAVQQAQDLARQAQVANAAKSEFLAKMSHEIRTPMNGVIGMTGLLLDTELSEEQRQFAEIIRSSGEGLLAVINDILDFSKIEAKRLDLEIADLDLRTTVEEAVEVLAVRAREKNLEFNCLVDPTIPATLRGDAGRLRQILVNLAGNAVKFTDRGEVTIRVRRDGAALDRMRLRFEVRDSGIGISQEDAARLFTAFTQADNSATRKFGGTGLGLAISKQLVELMHGEIGIDSTPGVGSTFWFTVLLDQPAQTSGIRHQAEFAGSGTRVLVVDDHASSREVMATMLRFWGCEVEEAGNDTEAVKRCDAAIRGDRAFDVVILDQEMPGVDGEEVGRRIQALGDGGMGRLILLTPIGRRATAESCSSEIFCATLSKPIRTEALGGALARAIDPSGVPEPLVPCGEIASDAAIITARGRVRILLAEDNVTNQTVAVAMLEKLGYHVEVVANGLEAVRALEHFPYDIVLMDCHMPEMDGFAATKAIRASSSVLNRKIPVIAMTASFLQGDREACFAAGMDGYISKPVRPTDLAAVLDRWLAPILDGEQLPAREIQPVVPPDPIQGFLHEVDTPMGTVLPLPMDGHCGPDAFREYEFLDRIGGDRELARLVISVFLDDMPAKVTELVAVIESGDPDRIVHSAHAIKGAAANLSLIDLAAIAKRIESLARAGDLAGVVATATGFEAIADRTFAALRASDLGRATA